MTLTSNALLPLLLACPLLAGTLEKRLPASETVSVPVAVPAAASLSAGAGASGSAAGDSSACAPPVRLSSDPAVTVGIEWLAGQGVRLNWNTVFGQGYLPQYRDSLNSGAWSNLMPNAVYEYDEYPTGQQQFLDRGARTAPRRFYRVVVPSE